MKIGVLVKTLSVINFILVIFLVLYLAEVIELSSSVFGALLISVVVLSSTGIYLKEIKKK